jgi:ABC-type Co2+ transport system permease subunit
MTGFVEVEVLIPIVIKVLFWGYVFVQCKEWNQQKNQASLSGFDCCMFLISCLVYPSTLRMEAREAD